MPSLKPSTYVDYDKAPQSLNTSSQKELSRVGDLGIDVVEATYAAPPNDDAYFPFRSPPQIWRAASGAFSKPHLFLHSLCLMSTDAGLMEYSGLREQVSALRSDKSLARPVRNMLVGWSLSRPEFQLTRMSPDRGVRVQWNAWDKTILHAFSGSASDKYGVTAKTLWLVFSSKSILTSKIRDEWHSELSDGIVLEWENWLVKEIKDFQEVLASFTH